jgi:UDP-N-acetylglucosamine diphosphorylase/glucosamine-1-phosphate N-acetyltransferase
MNYILFDSDLREALKPFTFTRPVADIRVGIMTIREKWEYLLNAETSTDTAAYLSVKWPKKEVAENIFIDGAILPDKRLVEQVKNLRETQALVSEGKLLAYFARKGQAYDSTTFEHIDFPEADITRISKTWDLFSYNHQAIKSDFEWLTAGRKSQPIPAGVAAFNESAIFIEEGAQLPLCSLNAQDGPIYIGKNSQVMEGSMIRGPFSLGDGSVVKMGAKIFGGTTVGPYCKIGGEVNNSILFGYSNKGHDGFLGNTVLGEWCNIGADTNTSNMKNNYAEVRLWNYASEGFDRTGLQFCGLMMGDHSKCGINTMFNTGTVVGVSANIFGSGFPRNFIPSFSWGGSHGTTVYKTTRAFDTAKAMMERRNVAFTAADRSILEEVFTQTACYRHGS